jgi:UDP-glucose 4-epimerase
MTRFLLSLDQAVDTVFAALEMALPGETFVPRAPAARMIDVATALIDGRGIEQVITGIRPGEKTHEIMVSDEEAVRTVERSNDRGQWYAISPMLPEVGGEVVGSGCLTAEYSSRDDVLGLDLTRALLQRHNLLISETEVVRAGELLR